MKATFQGDILQRALGEKGFKDIVEQYEAAKMRDGGGKMSRPGDKQIRLASLAKKVGYQEAARQAGTPVEAAYAAVNRVARWNYLTGEQH